MTMAYRTSRPGSASKTVFTLSRKIFACFSSSLPTFKLKTFIEEDIQGVDLDAWELVEEIQLVPDNMS